MIAEPEIYAIRLGYGLSQLEPPPETIGDYLESVKRAGPNGSIKGAAELRKLHNDYATQGKLAADGNEEAGRLAKELRREFASIRGNLIRLRVARAVGDRAGFGERLVQFWSDHFSVSARSLVHSAFMAAYAEETVRPYIGGKFADMLFAAETHPAMLMYLEQSGSIGPNSEIAVRQRQRRGRERGLNENLAREMIELHSLGVGADYTQTDVRQLAELLTGLNYNVNREEIFVPAMAEPGAETFLGRSYGGDEAATIDDIRTAIHDLATHDATAQHIARKLAVHFVSDNPPQELIDRLAGAFRDSNGDLSVVNATLAEAPELISHFRQKVRQPFDFIVAGMRSLGIVERNVMAFKGGQLKNTIINPLGQMGQPLIDSRGPDGWPEDAASWATPPGLAARMNWAFNAPANLRRVLPDPREFMTTALGRTASEALQWAVPKAESRREGIAVVLASSDFNRR